MRGGRWRSGGGVMLTLYRLSTDSGSLGTVTGVVHRNTMVLFPYHQRHNSYSFSSHLVGRLSP
eukprot:3786148-Rhodomonas_salina.1